MMPQKTFRADEQPVQVEAGFVFVRASTELHDVTICQDDFKAEDVIAGDTVFQATRPAGIGGDITPEGIIGRLAGSGG